MSIKSIKLYNFRNHEEFMAELSPSTTLIHGDNGSGKTSILEALYIACRGSSFRSGDRDIMRHDTTWYRVEVDDGSEQKIVTFTTESSRGKRFTIAERTFARLPTKYKKPVTLFIPDDLQLLTGSPARRRRYLDTINTQLSTSHGSILRKYERALMQRNKLLKHPHCTPDALFSWNVILAETGATIVSHRKRLVDDINRHITDQYRRIADNTDVIEIRYDYAEDSSQYLLRKLEEVYTHDKLVGSTSIGPHRHDFVVMINGRNAADTASRGENRSILLAMKYIESYIYHSELSVAPLILLDDVLGELDNVRQAQVPRVFADYQVIISGVATVASIKDTIYLK